MLSCYSDYVHVETNHAQNRQIYASVIKIIQPVCLFDFIAKLTVRTRWKFMYEISEYWLHSQKINKYMLYLVEYRYTYKVENQCPKIKLMMTNTNRLCKLDFCTFFSPISSFFYIVLSLILVSVHQTFL